MSSIFFSPENEPSPGRVVERHGRLLGPLATACFLVSLALFAGCGEAPQLGSEVAFEATDALWTAVTARDANLLKNCAARLKEIAARGELPSEAHAELTQVIDQAGAGNWESAAEDLRSFIEGQRKPNFN